MTTDIFRFERQGQRKNWHRAADGLQVWLPDDKKTFRLMDAKGAEADSRRFNVLENAIDYAERAHAVRIETAETGPDWEPTKAMAYYAQILKAGETLDNVAHGAFEFGPTPEAARAALIEKLVKGTAR